MVHERTAQAGVASQRLVQKHGAATGDREDLLDALSHKPVGNLLSNGFHLQPTVQNQIFQSDVLAVGAVDVLDREAFICFERL